MMKTMKGLRELCEGKDRYYRRKMREANPKKGKCCIWLEKLLKYIRRNYRKKNDA